MVRGLGFGLSNVNVLGFIPTANTIYVNQVAPGGGNGSYANPYNTLPALQDNYTYRIIGDYTTASSVTLTSRTGIKFLSHGPKLSKWTYTGGGNFVFKIVSSTNCAINLDIDGNGTTDNGVYLGLGAGATDVERYESGSGHTISGKIHNIYKNAEDAVAGIIGGGTNITIDHCEIYDVGSDGLYLKRNFNLTISNCHIHHVNQNYGNHNALGTGASGDGIQLDGIWENYRILNTIIDRSDAYTGNKFGLILNSAAGLNTSNWGIVEGCTFICKEGYDIPTAIYIAQGNGNIIRRNTFIGGTSGVRVSNYGTTNSCMNTLIHHNKFIGLQYGIGVASAGATDIRNTKAYNNLFFGVYGAHIWIDGTFIDASNNIHRRDGDAGVALSNSNGGTHTIRNNFYDSVETAGTPGTGINPQVGAPEFVDEVSNDFHLKANSICKGTGEDVGLTEDFDLLTITAPSIGPYN